MNICVIGAGPGGLIAAAQAAEFGDKVIVLEKNEKPGKKLYITGKGRCNVTNLKPVQDFSTAIVKNPKFMLSSLHAFSPQDTFSFFENLGVKLKVERGDRVFPESDKASDITSALVKLCKKRGVEFIFGFDVQSIEKSNDGFVISSSVNRVECTKVILASGGKSYSATGSNGAGYRFAKSLGHTIVPQVGALVPLKLKDDFVSGFEGISLKNVEISAFVSGKKKFSFFGEMLFTSFGISGPIVLSLSSFINRIPVSAVNFSLDLKPALSDHDLEVRIKRDIDNAHEKSLKNILPGIMIKRLIDQFLIFSGIDGNKKGKSLSEREIKILAHLMKNFPLTFDGPLDIDYAIITSGGVDVKEINPKTMESKLSQGLFFAGEIIDVDALTGGYNIQIALSTGYAAGNAARSDQ